MTGPTPKPNPTTWWDKLVVSLELADLNDPGAREKLDGAAAKANNQGTHLAAGWQYARALPMLTAAVEVWTQLGRINGAVLARNTRGGVLRKIGDYAGALDDHNAALTLASAQRFASGAISARVGIAAAQIELGLLDPPEDLLTGAAAFAAQEGYPAGAAHAQFWLGRLYEARKDWNAALGAYGRAVEGWRTLTAPVEEIEATAATARVMIAQGGAISAFTLVEQVLKHLGEHGPARLDDPLRVYWTIYRTLLMMRQAETAHEMLRAAHTLMIRQMEGLTPEQRAQFRAAHLHRDVAEEWASVQAAEDEDEGEDASEGEGDSGGGE